MISQKHIKTQEFSCVELRFGLRPSHALPAVLVSNGNGVTSSALLASSAAAAAAAAEGSSSFSIQPAGSNQGRSGSSSSSDHVAAVAASPLSYSAAGHTGPAASEGGTDGAVPPSMLACTLAEYLFPPPPGLDEVAASASTNDTSVASIPPHHARRLTLDVVDMGAEDTDRYVHRLLLHPLIVHQMFHWFASVAHSFRAEEAKEGAKRLLSLTPPGLGGPLGVSQLRYGAHTSCAISS